MTVHDTFRGGRAARRVDDHHLVRRRHLALRCGKQLIGHRCRDRQKIVTVPGPGASVGAAPCPDRAQRGMARAANRTVGLRRKVRHRRLKPRQVVGSEVRVGSQQHLHIGVPQHVPQFGSLVVRVQQGGDGADARDRQPGDDPVGPVRSKETHSCSLADAGREERLGHQRRSGMGVRIGEPGVAEHRQRVVAVVPGDVLNERRRRRLEWRQNRFLPVHHTSSRLSMARKPCEYSSTLPSTRL
ncbi:unannotated protein [freshwater metagenome]|uniref:Unannotated protein n=1 Tax=freshwater metagenome TaxID=449393 RepID=A0A6J7CE01_9ZZZZ